MVTNRCLILCTNMLFKITYYVKNVSGNHEEYVFFLYFLHKFISTDVPRHFIGLLFLFLRSSVKQYTEKWYWYILSSLLGAGKYIPKYVLNSHARNLFFDDIFKTNWTVLWNVEEKYFLTCSKKEIEKVWK